MSKISSFLSIRRISLVFFVIFIFFITIVAWFRFYHQSGFVTGLIIQPTSILKSDSNRTNLLFLGLRGNQHTDDNLTDSIIFISINHQTQQITLISLPRDIWSTQLVAKINTAYHYGQQQSSTGLALAMTTISQVLGQPIHYALALDFNGFIKAIDLVGGLDVNIPHTFDDYRYPIPDKETVEPESARYEHLHFEAGPTHFDGETALKYARSRHAEGEEGTDFARSARQQQIIFAFKDKLLSSSTLLSPSILTKLKNQLLTSVDTNITEAEFGAFVNLFIHFATSNPQYKTLAIYQLFATPPNLAPYQYQWVLIPSISWQEVHSYVEKNL